MTAVELAPITAIDLTVPVPVTVVGVHVLDYDRRTYMALSQDGTYWHLIQPAAEWDWLVREGKRHVGDLICTCQGGRMHGHCYRIADAEAFEALMETALFWKGDQTPVDEAGGPGGLLAVESTDMREAPVGSSATRPMGTGASRTRSRGRARAAAGAPA